jgi:hypothetical protein
MAMCLAQLQDPVGNAIPSTIQSWMAEQKVDQQFVEERKANDGISSSRIVRSIQQVTYAMAIGLLSIVAFSYVRLALSTKRHEPDIQKTESLPTSPEPLASGSLESSLARNTSPHRDRAQNQDLEWDSAVNTMRSLTQEMNELEAKLKDSMR